MAATRLTKNIVIPKPVNPSKSMATPPTVVLSMALMLIAAELRLIMVPLLFGTCSSARVAMEVMVVPAMAVPMAEASIATGTGNWMLK